MVCRLGFFNISRETEKARFRVFFLSTPLQKPQWPGPSGLEFWMQDCAAVFQQGDISAFLRTSICPNLDAEAGKGGGLKGLAFRSSFPSCFFSRMSETTRIGRAGPLEVYTRVVALSHGVIATNPWGPRLGDPWGGASPWNRVTKAAKIFRFCGGFFLYCPGPFGGTRAPVSAANAQSFFRRRLPLFLRPHRNYSFHCRGIFTHTFPGPPF